MYNVRACTSSVHPCKDGKAFCRAVWQALVRPVRPFWHSVYISSFQLCIYESEVYYETDYLSISGINGGRGSRTSSAFPLVRAENAQVLYDVCGTLRGQPLWQHRWLVRLSKSEKEKRFPRSFSFSAVTIFGQAWNRRAARVGDCKGGC